MKFPDLVHAVKMEPDRGFPQNASAHDTFWDFISLMPESLHMIMWAMSDRAIPRSLRMMEGFGVNTFRFVDGEGTARFVKLHWRPVLGAQSVVWDEAVAINGADQDFHRRDLWTAIDRGELPAFDLGVQVIDQATADALPFDVLDATKLVPEEVVPLRIVGRLTLERNPDNFFAETEQVAFDPGNLVPGIDVSDDPLLQGRLFSYLDTQLSRLGGPNFHEIPVNRPKGCPFHNLHRDGHMRQTVHTGRVSYEPSSLDPGGPREDPRRGFPTTPSGSEGARTRLRPESFADHYSQARMFFRSMTEPERQHIIAALGFELAKVETVAIRQRMLGHLEVIDAALAQGVGRALGMEGQATPVTPARPPQDLPPSPALSLLAKATPTLRGRVVGVLVSDGLDGPLLTKLAKALADEGARVEIVAPKIGGVSDASGAIWPVSHTFEGGPSVLFDHCAVMPSAGGVGELAMFAATVSWVRDAYAHLKVIGVAGGGSELVTAGGCIPDDAVIDLDKPDGVARFVATAMLGKHWVREPKVRPPR